MTTVFANTVPPLGTPPIADTFDRADDAASLGVADSGQAWEPLAGIWGVSGNKAVAAVSAPAKLAVVETGLADVVVTATLNPVDGSLSANAGVAFRVQDDSNYLGAYFWTDTGRVVFLRVIGGSPEIVDLQEYVAPTTSVLVVRCVGSLIEVYADSFLTLSITDTTFMAATKHGLFIEGAATIAWDDFSITPGGVPPTITLQLSGNAQRVSAATIYTAYNTGNQQGLVEQVIDYHVGQR